MRDGGVIHYWMLDVLNLFVFFSASFVPLRENLFWLRLVRPKLLVPLYEKSFFRVFRTTTLHFLVFFDRLFFRAFLKVLL
jgi:hypothetical protein